MRQLSVEEATEDFGRMLNEGFFRRDRSVNTADDYSGFKEERDVQTSIAYANSEEFRGLCVEEGLLRE